MIEGLDGLYDLKKTVGSGGFAKVKLATHILTGEKVAIKMMKKSTLGHDIHRVKLELEALKVLSHRHICKLYQVIETKTHYFIIIEYCSGGELFDHIVEKNRLSESESRKYFRQIVSAVAHLHSLGFVHRDLKPENILLDRDQNLKLIDFGLCAKPAGGMETHLYTSCGSPSYAAPELVLGQKYLGAEVDIWSLGVLLYALLCGYLPFDDMELPTLYSKILSGKYPQAEWLSDSSRSLIHSMLQVDPKKRITIEQLQTHPWLMAGGEGPLVNRHAQAVARDEECLAVLARHHGTSARQMWSRVSDWRYDYDTASYLLLLGRKSRGLAVRLVGNRHPLRSKLNRGMLNLNDLNEKTLNERVDLSPLKPVDNKTYLVLSGKESTPDCDAPAVSTPDKENETHADVIVMRKPHKRHHSPEPSPVPSKMTPRTARTLDRHAAPPTPRTPTRRSTAFLSPMESPSRSARRVLGSIERGLNRVRHVLTPRRRGKQGTGMDEPQVLTSKGLCNVSTTSSRDPQQVLDKLHQALISKGIAVKQKGFTLRGKQESHATKLSFELEVCVIGRPGSVTPDDVIDDVMGGTMVGIKRKRLKGDVWRYKRVCEEVLAMAAIEEPPYV